MSDIECPECGYDIWVEDNMIRDIWPALHVFFCRKCGYAGSMKIIRSNEKEGKEFLEERQKRFMEERKKRLVDKLHKES